MTTPQKKYSLPEMTHSFEIAIDGRETGHKWTGKFTYRRPSLGDRTRIETMRARLSGDLESLNPEVQDFIEAVSHLRYTLQVYPDWWAEQAFGLDMYDGNVVSEVYNRCLDYEASFRERMYSGDRTDVEQRNDDLRTEFTGATAGTTIEASAGL